MMGVSSLTISAAFTILSYVGLHYWGDFSLHELQLENLIGDINVENSKQGLQLLQGSYVTILLLANFVFNVFILLFLFLKTIFFSELHPSESRKLVERLVNYVIYKGAFLPLVIPPTVFYLGLWSTWLTVVCSIKMFQALARDRLERLNASPSTMPWTYFRVFSVLLFVLSADVYWIRFCHEVYRSLTSSLLLLFFEPLSIAFETLQAMLVHGFQLFEIWFYHSAANSSSCKSFKLLDSVKTGSLGEWKGILIRNLGFSLDLACLLMALGHYVNIWWLKGVAFHLVDAVLFLNIRALLGTIIKRIKGFIKLRVALRALHEALPDATSEELQEYEDECAICREPMTKAKKLQCNHLFHLPCLRSWLDQGSDERYSCPTCRKPLCLGRMGNDASPRISEVLSDERLARQISERINQNFPGRVLPAENQTRNSVEGSPWRSTGLDSSWLHDWPMQGVDEAGPSTSTRSVGLGSVPMMMRHLASVRETYAQTAIEDPAWSFWPMNPSRAAASTASIPAGSGERYPGAGLRTRTASPSRNDNTAHLLAMAETVREVLPHIPDELILEDLRRTNSVAVTVNNLLQM